MRTSTRSRVPAVMKNKHTLVSQLTGDLLLDTLGTIQIETAHPRCSHDHTRQRTLLLFPDPEPSKVGPKLIGQYFNVPPACVRRQWYSMATQTNT
jgi:hypothetical protein